MKEAMAKISLGDTDGAVALSAPQSAPRAQNDDIYGVPEAVEVATDEITPTTTTSTQCPWYYAIALPVV
jgi:hypothetical protein